MSSWFSSIALLNPFDSSESSSPPQSTVPHSPDHSPFHSGVKADLSALSHAVGAQLRGFASFLAPPPPPPSCATHAHVGPPHFPSLSSSDAIAGLWKDFMDIGGVLKTGISILAPHKPPVSESVDSTSSRSRSPGDDHQCEDGVVSSEVLQFARQISLTPELWTDFPISLPSDFRMSEVQKKHTAAIELLVPSFVNLRHKVCKDLTDHEFWMIYFILELPILSEKDLKVLSTSEIVEGVERLLHYLKTGRPEESENLQTSNTVLAGGNSNFSAGDDTPSEEMKNLAEVTDDAFQEKINNDKHNTEGKNPKEDCHKITSAEVKKPLEAEGDVSFSDLEEDDNDLSGRLSRGRGAARRSNLVSSPASESNEWIRLNKHSGAMQKDSEDDQSSDWSTIDDIDLDSLRAA